MIPRVSGAVSSLQFNVNNGSSARRAENSGSGGPDPRRADLPSMRVAQPCKLRTLIRWSEPLHARIADDAKGFRQRQGG
jgi:hypothetical protein